MLAWETGDAELLKFGEPCNGNPEPSPEKKSRREGVETRRAAPKPRTVLGEGEGIVQTANLLRVPRQSAASGGESRRRYENPLGRKAREGSTPSARTKHSYRTHDPFLPPIFFLHFTSAIQRRRFPAVLAVKGPPMNADEPRP